ncbi:MAG: hypothetical protein MZV63_23830 [Marinilabiliales bacterium]|nr:hypothetical protein [Marinilabiliales bacterium]
MFDKVVEDTSVVLPARLHAARTRLSDGRFRRIRVTLKQPGLKLEFRSGYYAPRDFAHSGRDDRAQQLQEQLLSDLPITGPAGARLGRLLPPEGRTATSCRVWFIVPGSQVQFSRASDKEKATLDVLGVIRDGQQQARRLDPGHGEAVGGGHRGRAAPQRAVRHQLRAAAGALPAEGRHPREPARDVRVVRLDAGRAEPRSQSAAAELRGARLAAPAGGEEERLQPAAARRPGTRRQRRARRHRGAADGLLLRGVRPRKPAAGRARRRRARPAAPVRCSRTSRSTRGASACCRPNWSPRSRSTSRTGRP